MDRPADLDALIARAQDGDVRAFETLVAGLLPQVRRFARAFAASEADADDLAQEALIRVYRNVRRFKYQSAFSTWVYAVARNLFLDQRRSRASREQALSGPLTPAESQHPSDRPAADESLQREQERARLWHALRRVPAEFRTALVLFDIEGHSYDEVAAVEQVPVGTVKSRLSRGRAHMRRILGESPEAESATGAGTSQPAPSSNLPGRGT